MMFPRKYVKPNHPIELDVYFTDTLSVSDITHIVIEQFKLLLFQRRQIPVPLEQVFLRKIAQSFINEYLLKNFSRREKVLQIINRFILLQIKCDVITHDESKIIKNETNDDEARKENFCNAKQFYQDRRRRIREERLKEKYIQKCKRFLNVYDDLEYCIKNILSFSGGNDLLSVSFIFGTSPISPKEIYRLQFPKGKYL